jgi:hypothetical protein
MTNGIISYLAKSPAESSRTTLVVCTALLALASASASLVFACATPFAAFAALAATVLPFRQALIAMACSWLVNQAIGFGLLGYPHTASTVAWGFVIGVAAVVALAASTMVWRARARFGALALYPFVLVASYAAYEVALFAVTPVLGGVEAFSGEIVGRLAFINAVWMIGLIAVYEIAHRAIIARAAGLPAGRKSAA